MSQSNASEVEIVEETPAPPSRPSTSAIPKRKARPPPAPTQGGSSDQNGAAPSKKSKSAVVNGTTTSHSRADQATIEALRAENEDLKRQLAESLEVADKFQEDFNKLQHLRLTVPEKALTDYIAAADERERILLEQNHTLIAQIPRLSEFIQPHASGLTILTREETDSKLNAFKNEVLHLRSTVEEQNQTINQLNQTVHDAQQELKEEIKRSTALAQHSDRHSATQGSSNGETIENKMKFAFYEQLTNIRVHTCRKSISPELGEVSELVCDCTASQKTLYFRLDMYKMPTLEDPNRLVDTVRFTPMGLENEKDDAYLNGLNTLREPFTFIKDSGPFDRQMWEFCTEVNNCMVAWQTEEEEEEEIVVSD
ncbi:hypothetical protein BDV93DRAFT_539857 [Ceratobasidium sp. AG-I]|nr:hypothetical protein BDV93DRAFT_539857 [Ceratobasidium sp. AG-I]